MVPTIIRRVVLGTSLVAVVITAWRPTTHISRRIVITGGTMGTFVLLQPLVGGTNNVAIGAEPQKSFTPSFVQEYDDFIKADGWSYRDVTTPGDSNATLGRDRAAMGDRVVFDWSGYTIGYFGRPFQAKGGPQGGAFDKDLDYARIVLGSGTYVRGLEKALLGMRAGQVRQVVIPYGELSYPESDLSHDIVGPKPSTFSGQRALNFVLQNPRIDRTLLFNVKVIRVDKPDGKGGFKRGS